MRLYNNIPLIESVADLADERARGTARRFGIQAHEISPLFSELQEHRRACRGDNEIDIDIGDPGTPLNALYTCQRMYASGAIVSYEFTRQEAFSLSAGNLAAISASKTSCLYAAPVFKVMRRSNEVGDYERFGMFCEEAIGHLDEEIKRCARKLLSA